MNTYPRVALGAEILPKEAHVFRALVNLVNRKLAHPLANIEVLLPQVQRQAGQSYRTQLVGQELHVRRVGQISTDQPLARVYLKPKIRLTLPLKHLVPLGAYVPRPCSKSSSCTSRGGKLCKFH